MKTRYVVYRSYLYVLAFALVSIGVISLVCSLRIQHPVPHAVALNTNSMLLCLFLGVALLAAVRRYIVALRIVAAILLAITLYGLLRNFLTGNTEIDASRFSSFLNMPSTLALTALLLMLGILLAISPPRIRRFGQATGVIAVLLHIIFQTIDWTTTFETSDLGANYWPSSLTSLFTVLLGIAVVLLGWLPHRRERKLDRLAVLAGGIGVLLTCLSWDVLSLKVIESINRESDLLLARMQSTVERNLHDHLALMQRMAERWQVLGQLPSPDFWQQEARSYLRDYPPLDALAVLDESLRPLWLEARDDEHGEWLEQSLSGAERRDWFRHVQEDRRAHISDAPRYAEKYNHTLIVVPIRLPTLQNGFVVASLDIQKSLSEALGSDLSGFGIRAYESGTLIFDSEGQGHAGVSIGSREIAFHHDLHLQLQSYVANPRELYASTHFPTLVMLFGLSLSFLLMLSQRLASLARVRAGHLEAANSELGRSLDRQMRLQALNQRIMDFSLDVLCSVDRQGCFRELSPSCETVFGYKPEEMIGRPFMDYVLPDDRSRTHEEAAAIMSGRATRSFHNRYRHRDGRIIHILWSSDWSEEDDVMFAVAHDITHLMQYEMFAEAQRDILGMVTSDRPLTETLEAICLMVQAQEPTVLASVLLTDPKGQRLVTGAAPSLPEGYSQAINGLVIGEDARACAAATFHRQLMVAEDLAQDPLWHDFRDLTLEHGLRACWSLPISHGGAVLGTLALYGREVQTPNEEQIELMDTAAQLAAVVIVRARDRQRLQESEQRFRSLFTFNPDPVFSFDLEGKFQSINAAGSALTGYSQNELLGQHFANFISTDDLDRVQSHFAAACAGEPQRYELQGQDRHDNPLMLDVTNLPMVVDGRIVGVFGIAKDISERQRMTDALQQSLQRTEDKAEQLRGLSAAAIVTASLRDDQQLIDYLVEQARGLIGAHQSMIVLKQGDGTPGLKGLSLSEKYATWQPDCIAKSLVFIRTLAGDTSQPFRLSQAELEANPRWAGFSSQFADNPPIHGCLAIPLLDKQGRGLGMLQLSDKYQGEFDEDDQAIARQFVQMAVAVLDNNRLLKEVRAGEERLQAQLDLTSTITNSMVEGLLATDTNGRLSFVNPAAQALIRLPAKQLVGAPLSNFLPLDAGDWQVTSDAACSERGEFCLLDGDESTFEYDARPMFAANGHRGWVIALRDVSAERRASQVLRERKQFFTLSLEMFCMVDMRGCFVQVNPAFATVLNYSIAELVERPYLEIVHPDDHLEVEMAVQQLSRGELIQDLEIRAFDALNREHWLQLSAAMGDDRLIYCVARDITERRAIEQQIRQNNLLLGMAGRTAKLGGWDLELPSMTLVWSDEMRELLGYPPHALPSLEHGLALCAEQDRAELKAAIRDCIEHGQGFDLDLGFHLANGLLIDARVTGQPIRDDHGRIVRLVGAFQNISERKQAQRETHRLAESLTNTLESISDAFHTFDNDWRFTYINSESARLLGMRVEDMLGAVVWSAFPGLRDSEVGTRFLRAVESLEAEHFDTFYEPLGLWLEVHAYPSEEGLAVYFQDISERKHTEQELQSTLQELERSNRELEEFAFAASHDLQEPLRKIQAFSERLETRATGLDDDGRDYLKRMTSAAARMQALIIDLLDYSRVNTRGQPFQRLHLGEIVSEVLQDMETTLEQTQAQVEYGELPSVMGDASQLRRVIQNLLSNAVKFQSPDSHPLIHIYVEPASNDAYTLCFTDNGIGFDEKYLDRIFNPFQRLHGRGVYAGTGIGLAIVKKIAERHGARITATSSPGKGSTFRITFPHIDEASA
ncbi:PAS domain S-box protein [Stutzerimonas sp. VN223-3]|uniref:PAS domain S-box protein n=1 Tax=Stutzerimonas sp. VN223-3 TaxID=3384601 RepID=UPI0038B4AC60